MRGNGKVLVVLASLALSGVVVMLAATRLGVGVPPDATVYLDAARNLGAGRGLVVISSTRPELVPLTHYPPLYSSLLALVSLTGPTVETAGRWLNAILFGVNIFLVGFSVACLARQSFWLPVTAALLTLTAPDVLANHSLALTEPLYLALTLVGLLCLGGYLRNQRRPLLVIGAIFIALSILTRFVGVAGAATGSAALLFLNREQRDGDHFGPSFSREVWRRRVADTFIFGVVSCAPVALWSIRNRLVTGGASDRQFAFHPLTVQQIVPGFSTAAQWLLLGKVRSDVRILAFIVQVIVITSLTLYLLKRRTPLETGSEEWQSRLPRLLIIFVVFYAGLLIFTVTFFESDTVFDNRSLLPVHFALLILAPLLTRGLLAGVPKSGSLRLVFVCLALLLAGSYAFRGARWLVQVQADGQGYASRAWKESATIAQIRKLPAGAPIYSNGFDAIYYLTGKRAQNIPEKIIHGTGRPNAGYEAERQRMSDDLQQHHGVVVYFRTLTERWFLPLESELKSELPLSEIAIAPDGSIYELRPNNGNQLGH